MKLTFLLASLPVACLAAEYACPLPEEANKFSAIVLNDMDNAAHNIYRGVSVGGTFKNTQSSNQHITVDGKSYVGSNNVSRVNWNKGVVKGATLEDAGFDWSYFEYMAKNVKNRNQNGYKIVRKTNGGTFNTYNFRNGGQGEDNGKTIVFFDTTDKIILTKTNDGRQFGPSVIAPFSECQVHGNAGFIDGIIVCKSLITKGGNPGQLQLHGDIFTGPYIPCKEPFQTQTPDPSSSPSSSPSARPSSSPSSSPSEQPISSPSSSPSVQPTSSPTKAPTPAGGKGDPHFKTWKNEHFEYHGQCDMILLKDPDFANGLGIEVQIRTKLVRHWSYIKNAAVRIGTEILEVEGNADASKKFRYWYNFDPRAKIDSIAGFPIIFKNQNKGSNYKSGLEIDLSSIYPDAKIVLDTWKEFVRVEFANPTEAAYGKSVGLLGNYHTGETLARDGTVLDDFGSFGNNWQVLPSESMLFRIVEQPQFPKKCIEPEDPRGERRRRLNEFSVTEEKAEAACASIADELDRKDCVYDIIATQDLEMAGAY